MRHFVADATQRAQLEALLRSQVESTTHDEEHCLNLGWLPEEHDLPLPGGTDTTGGHDGPDTDSGPPILDEQLPLP